MLRLSRRSEYSHAANLARKARRRGDAAAAAQWLKHAERLQFIEKRHHEIIHAWKLRDTELEEVREPRAEESGWPKRVRCHDHVQAHIDRFLEAAEADPSLLDDDAPPFPYQE